MKNIVVGALLSQGSNSLQIKSKLSLFGPKDCYNSNIKQAPCQEFDKEDQQEFDDQQCNKVNPNNWQKNCEQFPQHDDHQEVSQQFCSNPQFSNDQYLEDDNIQPSRQEICQKNDFERIKQDYFQDNLIPKEQFEDQASQQQTNKNIDNKKACHEQETYEPCSDTLENKEVCPTTQKEEAINRIICDKETSRQKCLLRKGLDKPLPTQDLDCDQLNTEKFEKLFKDSEINLDKDLKPKEFEEKCEIRLPATECEKVDIEPKAQKQAQEKKQVEKDVKKVAEKQQINQTENTTKARVQKRPQDQNDYCYPKENIKQTCPVYKPENVKPKEEKPVCSICDQNVCDQELPGTCSIWTSALNKQQDFSHVLAKECEGEFLRLKELFPEIKIKVTWQPDGGDGCSEWISPECS